MPETQKAFNQNSAPFIPKELGGTSDYHNKLIAKLTEARKEERKKEGLSLEQLANNIGISKKKLENYEKGEQIPSLYILHLLANALKKPISLFLVNTETDSAGEKIDNSLGCKYSEEQEERFYVELGKRILEERTKQELTHEYIGLKINTSHKSIAHYEQGKVKPTLYNIEMIAKTLGLPTSDLIPRLEPINSPNPKIVQQPTATPK